MSCWGLSTAMRCGRFAPLARVDRLVPYNTEEEMKKRGALYEKARLPFVSYTVVDGNLVTGQNPGSAKATATKIVAAIAR